MLGRIKVDSYLFVAKNVLIRLGELTTKKSKKIKNQGTKPGEKVLSCVGAKEHADTVPAERMTRLSATTWDGIPFLQACEPT